MIKNKYLENYKTYYQRVINVSSLDIEAPPGTVVYVKDSNQQEYSKHIIENGYLNLQDDEVSILALYFYGIQLNRITNNTSILFRPTFLRTNEYFETNETYDTNLEIRNPQQGYVYKINSIITENNDNTPSINNAEGMYKDGAGNLVLEVGPSSYEILAGEDSADYYLLLSQANFNQYQMPMSNSYVEDNEGFEEDPFGDLILKLGTSASYENYEIANDIYYILLLARLRAEQQQQNRYIYYNNNWYPMVGDVMVCPIEGIINYYFELTKGVYR